MNFDVCDRDYRVIATVRPGDVPPEAEVLYVLSKDGDLRRTFMFDSDRLVYREVTSHVFSIAGDGLALAEPSAVEVVRAVEAHDSGSERDSR